MTNVWNLLTRLRTYDIIMTNEEKAKEIGHTYARQYRHNCGGDDFVFSSEECSDSALEMAKFKDDYFKKVLEDKLSFFEGMYKESHSEYMGGACDGIRSVLNVLFSEKK